MSILNFVSLLGGLALFLYGVSLMGDGLNMIAGNRLQVVLYHLTSNPFRGILLGLGVTALIQSSTATSVMAIGFVNSGMMTFYQAVSVILGSIVGTSVTGWIVGLSSMGQGSGIGSVLSPAFITGVMATAGIVLVKFSKKDSHHRVGTILLGFSVLMFGMNMMSEAVTPLRESESFIRVLTAFSNPFLGILVGIVFTAVIQSSAAAIGILQALSMTGALSFAEAYPIILGIAVGGALPVLISALGASVNAKRTALVHLVIDIIGAALCGIAFYAANAAHPFGFMDAPLNPISVALVNTIFRIVTVAVLTPAIGLLERLVCGIIPDGADGAIKGDWDLLEERFVNHPALAIEQCRIVIGSMAELVRQNLYEAFRLLYEYDDEGFERVVEMEDTADKYEDKLGTYLIRVSSGEMTQRQNEDVYQFLHAITDLERISDHANNIAEGAKEIYDKQIVMTEEVTGEVRVMEAALSEVLGLAISALTGGDQDAANHVEPLEELIDNLCDELKHRHIERVRRGVYSRQHSFVFNDLINNYERVSDHCSNIAVAMLELRNDAFDMHNYVESLKQHKDDTFDRYFEEYRQKYQF